jgi:hypothetical protein
VTRFGLGVELDAASRAEILTLLQVETHKERTAQGDGDTDLMKLLCTQLFLAGTVEDMLAIWAAKSASMDANGAIDVQLLCGAGLERTKAFLRERSEPAAAAALGRIVEAERAGEYEMFTPALWGARCIDWYTTPDEVAECMRAANIDKRPQVIGYWRSEDAWASWCPDPQILRSPGWVSPADKQQILAYLRSGNEAAYFMGYSFCRIPDGPPAEEMGCRELTDGDWMWPQGLAVYVDLFDVRLPEEFVATMRANDFVVPHIDKRRASRLHNAASLGFWRIWSSREISLRPSDGSR